jgi:TRAP transporter 4TM/12TM fusion protein
MTTAPAPALRGLVHTLYYATATFFTVYLIYYYLTGEGGPTVLAVALVPACFVLFVLDELRKDALYPHLGWIANHVIAAAYMALAFVAGGYLTIEFYDISTVRMGFWNRTDLIMGGIVALLIMEYARKRYFILFVINIVLILYAVYGWLVPGMFGHPGFGWVRIVSAMSVEGSTGVFSRLPQLALTLIGSFILVLSLLRAFGCVDSILLGAGRIATRSPHALPQAAVIGSFGVATVSGSGAANAATTGSATIPAMIGAGMPRTNAAAIETAASLGGQLMPPIMGISAFLMAEFMGRSYFDVVARGYAPAIIYFISVWLAVYLLSVHFRPNRPVLTEAPRFAWHDGVNLVVFAGVVGGLIGLMGIRKVPAMIAALWVFMAIAPPLFLFYLARNFLVERTISLRTLVAPVGRLIDGFTSMTSDLTLLLATLSIMTGAFVITGVPTKLGYILVEAAGVNLVAMVLVAFVFGALLGTGLPPAPTYILTALVIVPPMIKFGVDPWVVHFFAFFLAVWGELTPPTSVVAAVTAKIADASFMKTLGRALLLCVSLFMLMAGVFVRPALVLEPGVSQLAAMALILTAAIGVTFAIQAHFSDNRLTDIALRLVLGAISMVVLFYPSDEVAALTGVPVFAFAVYWFMRRRPIPVQVKQPA